MTTSNGYKVLVVEDDANERHGLQRLLTDAGYQVSAADSADKAMSYMDEAVDFVLTDLQMGDVSGMDLLRHWKLKQPETMFLMITGHASTVSAIEAIRLGAYDYMTKPLDVNKLIVTLQNMVKLREESRKTRELQNRLDEKFSLSNIIGRSPQMQRVFELIRRSAQAFSTVLILGESGTGKELVAQAIHQNSPRRDGPFVAVNCAAMAPTLVESELFGHEKGSFTGADQRRIGRFEQASGGTLFIDEIGEFEVSLQVKLLRVMENRVITPVGGNKDIKVDTRVLAATSRDIRDMMAKGTFREDLYYRLNVITIDLPPLRQRLDDIPLLVKRFMERVNKQNGTSITSIAPNVIDALQKYQWPGNVRELLNIIERMMVLTDKACSKPTTFPPSSKPVRPTASLLPASRCLPLKRLFPRLPVHLPRPAMSPRRLPPISMPLSLPSPSPTSKSAPSRPPSCASTTIAPAPRGRWGSASARCSANSARRTPPTAPTPRPPPPEGADEAALANETPPVPDSLVGSGSS